MIDAVSENSPTYNCLAVSKALDYPMLGKWANGSNLQNHAYAVLRGNDILQVTLVGGEKPLIQMGVPELSEIGITSKRAGI